MSLVWDKLQQMPEEIKQNSEILHKAHAATCDINSIHYIAFLNIRLI
jgi:hypothetical protein